MNSLTISIVVCAFGSISAQSDLNLVLSLESLRNVILSVEACSNEFKIATDVLASSGNFQISALLIDGIMGSLDVSVNELEILQNLPLLSTNLLRWIEVVNSATKLHVAVDGVEIDKANIIQDPNEAINKVQKSADDLLLAVTNMLNQFNNII